MFRPDVPCLLINKKHDDLLQHPNLKKVDGSSFPPCHKAFIEKINHGNFVTCLWRNATKISPSLFNPENFSWAMEDGMHSINLSNGDYISPVVGITIDYQSEN